MRLQAKLIICLIVFGLVSYSLDAVTTAIGLNWGYVETKSLCYSNDKYLWFSTCFFI